MSPVKLYMVGVSAPCRSVYLTVKALDMPVEIIYVDYRNKEHLQPEFVKINPEHKVPAIQDGDFGLWESRTIMRYLVGKFGGDDNTLYPKDLQQRAVVDRLLDHDCGSFNKTMLDDIIGPVRLKQEPTQRQAEKVARACRWLDREVRGKTYLTGDHVTIADFAVVVSFCNCEFLPDGDMDKYPHAMAWYQRMQQLPYYEEVYKPCHEQTLP